MTTRSRRGAASAAHRRLSDGPNVGKSTLVNALLGEERMLTGPEAGITRDAIAVELEWQGRPLRCCSIPPGCGAKCAVEGKAEKLAVGRRAARPSVLPRSWC